jgi:hypothetical protein
LGIKDCNSEQNRHDLSSICSFPVSDLKYVV